MSGSLARGFLDDIVANIDDDVPRLVYADWLLENGQEERADFIRLQIERARLPAWDAAQVRLRLREQELLKAHGEAWLAELPTIEGAKWEGFRRGIVARVSFASFEAMRANAHACRAAAPVEAIKVRWPRRGEADKASAPIAELRELSLTGRPDGMREVGRVADSPQLSTLRSLSAHGLWADSMGRLVASPHLGSLKVLRLPANNLGNAGLRALTESASLTTLEELDLSGRGGYERYNDDPIIHSAGLEELVAWPGLAGLRSLTLAGNDLRRPGLRALLRAPHASALKELSLRNGRLDGQVMDEFAYAHPDLRLETLDLGENILKELGVAYFASARCVSELKALWLDRCEVPLPGARLLAKAAFFSGLRLLNVSHNYFGPAGLTAVLEGEPASLHTLLMRDNNLFDKGATLLAGSPASDGLLEVDLGQNGLGAGGALALGETTHLRGLLVLRLVDNPLNEQAATHLAASPLGQRLAVLELEGPPAPEPPVPAPPPALPGEYDIPF
jgi:uncharacterized protein (TIGR02996 family)